MDDYKQEYAKIFNLEKAKIIEKCREDLSKLEELSKNSIKFNENEFNKQIAHYYSLYKNKTDEELIEIAYILTNDYEKSVVFACKLFLMEKFEILKFEKEKQEILININNDLIKKYVYISLNVYVENKTGKIFLTISILILLCFYLLDYLYDISNGLPNWLYKLVYVLVFMGALRTSGFYHRGRSWEMDEDILNEYEERVANHIIYSEKRKIKYFKFSNYPVEKSILKAELLDEKKKRIIEELESFRK